MFTMKGRHSWVCVALLQALSCVLAVERLDSIEDLKEIDFGGSVPTHSLMLLHWFANIIVIDHNNRLRLTFNPSNGDYGTHHYGNYEEVLDPLPRGHQYYIVGNLHQETSAELPDHVVDPPSWLDGGNRDRIIIRVCGERIDRVYLTQHYDNSDYQETTYDPYHTYQITTNLLRQIREFSQSTNYHTLMALRNRYEGFVDVSTIKKNWGHLACLGLFLCIVMNETVYFQEQRRRPGRRQRHELNQSRELSNKSNNNSCPCTLDQCLCCGLALVVCIIVFLFFCAANLPKK